MRVGDIQRETSETQVYARVDLDGVGASKISTGIKFLDHMLTSLATHSLIDIEVKAQGDLQHHIVEDVALTLGSAFKKSLGNYLSITRFGSAIVPMDEALASVTIDLSNRPYSVIDLKTEGYAIEDAVIEDLRHWFESFAQASGSTLHIRVEYGGNDHHKLEAVFKALALSLRQATSRD
ncbi:MAG: imidazoleglycerol-phosphate dehydratase HisB, partial [Candidatus Bathyarchaeota archaeon]|nr:imidazoleglycerol-phosphate dehydratase HisB [Candidatus Bathyarchaeota archaeon]